METCVEVACLNEPGQIVISDIVPFAFHYRVLYGGLVWPGETLPLKEFINRLFAELEGNEQAERDAMRLACWDKLMGCVESYGEMPVEFVFSGVVCDYDACLTILGPAAVKHLRVAMTV
jgi:hypothetical protein